MVRLDPSIPDIDLYSSERKQATKQIQKRNLSASLGVAAAALVLGAIGMLMYGREISETRAATEAALARAREYRSQSYMSDEARAKDAALYHQLRQSGIPITAVMDSLAGNLAQGVGLKSVRVNPDFTFVVEGEATDVARMLDTVQHLQAQPVFFNTKLESFSGADKSSAASGVTFTAKGEIVSIDRIANTRRPDPNSRPEVSN